MSGQRASVSNANEILIDQTYLTEYSRKQNLFWILCQCVLSIGIFDRKKALFLFFFSRSFTFGMCPFHKFDVIANISVVIIIIIVIVVTVAGAAAASANILTFSSVHLTQAPKNTKIPRHFFRNINDNHYTALAAQSCTIYIL